MHVKGHIRDPFLETVERCGELPGLEDRVAAMEDYTGRALTWGSLLGLLWNCTDIVPGDVCEDLGAPRGSTYAQLVRGIKAASEPAIV